jgi:hypothetical protein
MVGLSTKFLLGLGKVCVRAPIASPRVELTSKIDAKELAEQVYLEPVRQNHGLIVFANRRKSASPGK